MLPTLGCIEGGTYGHPLLGVLSSSPDPVHVVSQQSPIYTHWVLGVRWGGESVVGW